MAKANSIPPFPADIDRDSFGHWLSGFVDGEGCFMLNRYKRLGKDRCGRTWKLSIALRDDDSDILSIIHSFLQVGHLNNRAVPRGTVFNTKPQLVFSVTRIEQLVDTIIPHFDAYPLRAKKAGDYAIWREGVLLAHRVGQRSARELGGNFCSQWSNAELNHFDRLVVLIKANRKYSSDPVQLPVLAEPEQEQLVLFG